MWVSPWKVSSSVSPSEIEWSFDVEANRHTHGDFALSVHKEGLAWRDFSNRQWGSGASCCFHSCMSVDSSFASANVAGSMSCWLAALQQRSHLESRLATVGRLYSDITVSESHFHFVKLYIMVHVTKKSPCSQHSSCLCIFLRGWHIDRREKGAGKSRSQPLQNRNARARAQTKREVRQKKGNWNLSISKERKKQWDREGPVNSPENAKKQETVRARGTLWRTRPHISMVNLESVWFWRHGVLWRHFSRSLCTRFLLQLLQALWTEFLSSAKG